MMIANVSVANESDRYDKSIDKVRVLDPYYLEDVKNGKSTQIIIFLYIFAS